MTRLIAAIAAPILFVAGQALLPNLGRDVDTAFALMLEHRDQLIASRLLTTAGAFLLIASLSYLKELRGAKVGAMIAMVGTFFNAFSNGVQGYAAWGATAPGLDHDASMQTLLHLEDGVVGLPVSYWSIPVFGIGLVVMAIGLLAKKAVPWWTPALLLLGVVASFPTAGLGPIVALAQAPLAAAVIILVRQALVVRRATVHA